jgi:hypothetical protein
VEKIAQVDLWHKTSDAVSGGLITSHWDGREAVLLLTAPDLDITLEIRGRDIFDALQQLRLKLEPIGWYPLCNGARVDCYPSGMARDMGGAQAVYVLTIGKSGKPPLVGTLEPAARDNVGTVTEQDAYFRRWLDTTKR